jgi:hypothetical protein
MQKALDVSGRNRRREPWNKGKLIGAKPPLRPKHVWSIRSKLQAEGRTRDLALFDLAIDSKLRGCDVVRLRSRILRRKAWQPSVHSCASRRPASPSALR